MIGKKIFNLCVIWFVFKFTLLSVVVLPIVRFSPTLLVYGQTPSLNFRGKVVDYTTNRPIPKATVNVSDSNKVLVTVETDANGVYNLRSLMPGNYVIRVTVGGYHNYEQAYLLPVTRTDSVLEIPLIALSRLTNRLIGPGILDPNLVKVSFSVTDQYGRYVSGLGKNNFMVIEDGSTKAIDYFSDDPEPFTVGFVFALSEATSIELLNATRDAFLQFFPAIESHFYEFIVVRYNSRTDAVIKDTFSVSTDRPVVFVKPKPNTGVFEACSLAIETIEKRSATPGKVLVLVTDMLDNPSLGVSDKLYRQLREFDIKFFVVATPGKQNLYGVIKDDNSPIVKLDELTSLSGGQMIFIPGLKDLNDYFVMLASRLQTFYTIGFKSSALETERNRYRVKIKVTAPRGIPHLTAGNDEGFLWGRKPLIVVHP